MKLDEAVVLCVLQLYQVSLNYDEKKIVLHQTHLTVRLFGAGEFGHSLIPDKPSGG